MGDWTDKNNRIDILYNGSRRFLCVEHPALIQNHDKALQTLGGIETLQQIFSDSQKRLPLLWRPDNIYCKPAYGDRFSVSNLLMKVTKRRRKSDGREDYKVEFCGHIDTSYRFQAMADFQYLPMQLKPDGQYENIYNKVVIDHLVPRSKYFDSDVPLYIPPLTFSRVDKTIDFNFKLPIKHGPSYKNPDDDRPAHYIGTVRQRRTIYTVFVNYGETLPTKPQPEAVERMNSNFVNKECKEKLEKLFEMKPVYLKVELEHKTGTSIMKLKSYLPAMAFYWLDGPWRAQWNKFGFDPTKNPSAKIYQTIDFRIRQLRPGQWWIKAKRGAGRLVQYNQTAHNQKHNVKISLQSLGDQKQDSEEGQEDKLQEQEALYKFRPDTVPPQRMMYYPAQYVEIPEVQKLIHKNDGRLKRKGYKVQINTPSVQCERRESAVHLQFTRLDKLMHAVEAL
ncbi:general transcription factor 3C polypeptide 5-like [Mya arenaria]|uniref:general transcription factor 3C polypeptide 5-like n=1 Tax=Mya arenaria TaxID=6604 RepID=UPI0022E5C9E4|nr:general transcription factor 3C polypeptide 5-like [Mya arenaria]